jgi:flagellar hook-length control protein FliK
VLLPDDKTPEASSEKAAVLFDGQPTDAHAESNKTNSTAAVTSSDMLAKSPANADPINQSDLQSPFRAVVQASDMSAGHDTSGTEQFLNQEHTSSESRNGSDHAKLNLLPSDDVSLRPQFLDQTTGVSPSAPPAVESRIGRGEAGQTVVIHGSERIHDLPGGTASAQTVTLDLDPLDMGPLRVRIMMTEQIIHTHIRTEHGELGQGLLQQGSSLEASLRTTGFEMGTLRVTVDQQQQGRGESPWTFQQQQGREQFLSGKPAATGEEPRASRALQDIDNNGRVSWFA